MWVSGTPVNFVDNEVEEDDFIEQKAFDDSNLGKLGGHQIPEAANAVGYKEIVVTDDFEPQWDVEDYFRNKIPESSSGTASGYSRDSRSRQGRIQEHRGRISRRIW